MLTPVSNIDSKIYQLRDTSVMLDSDLAELYGVETKHINQAVVRNLEKFPDDFRFKLSQEELDSLRSQIVTANFSMIRTTPSAFTEQGVYMLATILKSPQATHTTINIMRTFTKIRQSILTYDALSKQIQQLKEEITHNKAWTKERLSAIADAMIILEDSLGETQDMIVEINSSNEIEKIGFLRSQL